jgi:hypothetical protein
MYQEATNAIENLYRVFSKYPLRPHIPGCPFDIGPEDHQRIREKPLRDLTTDDIRSFVTHAVHLWGDAQDLKHFLPRILELIFHYPEQWTYEVLTAAAALRLADWLNWPEVEQDAVHTYFIELWRHVLSQEPVEWWADPHMNHFTAIVRTEDNLIPFLAMLENDQSEYVLLRIAQLIDMNTSDSVVNEGKLFELYREECEEQHLQVREWLLKPEIDNLLQNAFRLYLARNYKGKSEAEYNFAQFRQFREVQRSNS